MIAATRSPAVLLALAMLLAGCARRPAPQPLPVTGAGAAPATTVALSQVDVGASMLAGVENARQAIAFGDRIAGANDLGQAQGFAMQLTNHSSRLIPSEPTILGTRRSAGTSAPDRPRARLTVFGVQVRLTSASAELTTGDFAAADADLRAVQDSIPDRLIPGDLPLLRAAASLDLARSAAFSGLIPELRTQLLCAQRALSSYTGPAHVAEAKALAALIERRLASGGTLTMMLPYQLSLWLGRVVELAGSDRWSA
jgi:hypothetical protein